MTSRTLLIAFPLLVGMLAGCTNVFAPTPPPEGYQQLGFHGLDTTGTNPSAWPRLDGQELRVLDNGAFYGFNDAKKAFENLTGAHVVDVSAQDAGDALQKVNLENGNPSVDVVYGLDNLLLYSAVTNGSLQPYKPLLAGRIDPHLVFFDANGTWYATPVDHGYIAVNIDRSNPDHAGQPGQPAMKGITVATFSDVAAHAGELVIPSPKHSTPGLGFLVASIVKFGETPSSYNWQSYWTDLFQGSTNGADCRIACTHTGRALVVPSWTIAYENHFSGGYGAKRYGGAGLGDYGMVVSYTESPAYEAFTGHGGHPDEVADVLETPGTTFHQIQTMAILKGTKHLAAAQAWVEFTLTDAFQSTRASDDAVYPVVGSVTVDATYQGRDPDPATLHPATIDWQTVGRNLPRWLAAWDDLCTTYSQTKPC